MIHCGKTWDWGVSGKGPEMEVKLACLKNSEEVDVSRVTVSKGKRKPRSHGALEITVSRQCSNPREPRAGSPGRF